MHGVGGLDPVVGQQTKGLGEARECRCVEPRGDCHGRILPLIALPPPVADLTHPVDFLPFLCDTGRVLTDVVALVLPGVASFELGVLCEVFGLDRSDDGLPNYDFAVAGLVAGQALPMSSGGQLLTPAYGLERAATADLVAVTPFPIGVRPPDA